MMKDRGVVASGLFLMTTLGMFLVAGISASLDVPALPEPAPNVQPCPTPAPQPTPNPQPSPQPNNPRPNNPRPQPKP